MELSRSYLVSIKVIISNITNLDISSIVNDSITVLTFTVKMQGYIKLTIQAPIRIKMVYEFSLN